MHSFLVTRDLMRRSGVLPRPVSSRDPRSCTYTQLEEAVSFDLAEVLATTANLTVPAATAEPVLTP
jgi:hypothetical protein